MNGNRKKLKVQDIDSLFIQTEGFNLANVLRGVQLCYGEVLKIVEDLKQKKTNTWKILTL